MLSADQDILKTLMRDIERRNERRRRCQALVKLTAAFDEGYRQGGEIEAERRLKECFYEMYPPPKARSASQRIRHHDWSMAN